MTGVQTCALPICQQLHARTAAALAERSPDLIESQPELLAHHLTEAGAADEAVSYWLKAGKRSLERSALREAVSHLRHGLQLLGAMAATPLNTERRLQFMVLLGPALISLSGPGSTEVEDLYAVAFDVCQKAPESDHHFAVYWGWWRVARDYKDRKSRADALLTRAEASRHSDLILQAHHCQWASQFDLGDLAACSCHIHKGLDIYAQGDFRDHAALYGNHDAKVCGHGELALVSWLQGHAELALTEERKSAAWASELAHDGSIGHAMDIALMHRFYRREARQVLARADAMIRFAEEKGFADYASKGQLFQGWARAVLGDPGGGLELFQRGLALQKQIGTMEDFPVYYCMLAELLERAGKPDEALSETAAAQTLLEKAGLVMWMPELQRRRGELILRVNPQDADAAQAAFAQALHSAAAQGAKPLELRAGLNIARLRRSSGDDAGATDMITALLAAYPPGAETGDVKNAKLFLAAYGAQSGVA